MVETSLNLSYSFHHGGDIYTMVKILGTDVNSIIDLSTSVNPLPLPSKYKEALLKNFSQINKYPDPFFRSFKETLQEVYGIPEENVLCGNGSTELIYLFVNALAPKKAVILEPTFNEYKRACKLYNVNVDKIFSLDKDLLFERMLKKLSKNKIDLVFVCNPNNPTGWLYKKEDLLDAILKFSTSTFIVDEAFIDFVEKDSLIKEATMLDNLIVLRSLTKFYGLTGLRFGYAISKKKLIQKALRFLPPWNVNTFSQILASLILKDEDFKRRALNFFIKEKKYFERKLNLLSQKYPLSYFPSVANFYLLKLPNDDLFEFCFKEGILIRDCSNFYGLDKHYVRVSVKFRKWSQRFFDALERWLVYK
jgi:threonine-phosphate decarboxylase